MERLKSFRKFAEELRDRGYTINILHKGNLVLRMGKDAEPGLLSLFGPIEVKDIKAVARILNA
ncbi:MAG: hypothetical protein ACE5PM_08285 [Candidatus Hydrothermarchaeales archaeon]